VSIAKVDQIFQGLVEKMFVSEETAETRSAETNS
jgi:hypothetical protein